MGRSEHAPGRPGRAGLVVLAGVTLAAVSACARAAVQDGDAAFTELQARGQQAMGVDQYTSTHVFDALPDGGRIELQRNVDDEEGVRTIREHLAGIAQAFSSGDFSTPAFVHMREVPGAAVMAARRDAIRYEVRDLPRGGEVRITTNDAEAIRAIHEFMAFQREDHRAAGHEHGREDHGGSEPGSMDHRTMDHGSMDHGSMDHEAMHRAEMARIEDRELAADMDVVHQLFESHESIRRTVTNLPNGIRTETASDDPHVRELIIDHVDRMAARLREGLVFNMRSPSLPHIFEKADRIRTEIERTAAGVVVVQTSDDPETVAALQAHAAEVDEMVREGMAALMRSAGPGGGHSRH